MAAAAPQHFDYYLDAFWSSLGGPSLLLQSVSQHGAGNLASLYPVSDLASASIAAAGLAIAEWRGTQETAVPAVTVNRRLASLWFKSSIAPQGWDLPPVWDAFAGDYRARDGWIRLHTNAPHHRAAALGVLGDPADRAATAARVAQWDGEELETAIVAAGGCAAFMRTAESWAAHPQGTAVAQEQLVDCKLTPAPRRAAQALHRERPLAGIRVLDLTRILAGPTATRFLAGYGADVLRIDPPGWDEPTLLAEMTLGKSCARLNLRDKTDYARFEELLATADIFVHGYRSDALDTLGLGDARRRTLNPGLIDVALDAYGWSGPWRGRRGFDSLVQMSCGIAAAGMAAFERGQPTPLPVQALDYATGYLLAAAAIRGLTQRTKTGSGAAMRLSLARMAALLVSRTETCADTIGPPAGDDFTSEPEATPWGPLLRLLPPVTIAGSPMFWQRGAGELGHAPAQWQRG